MNASDESGFKPHEMRVIQECQELGEKLFALQEFLSTATYRTLPAPEQGRLAMQCSAMHIYWSVLRDRIGNFQA